MSSTTISWRPSPADLLDLLALLVLLVLPVLQGFPVLRAQWVLPAPLVPRDLLAQTVLPVHPEPPDPLVLRVLKVHRVLPVQGEEGPSTVRGARLTSRRPARFSRSTLTYSSGVRQPSCPSRSAPTMKAR